MAIKKLKQYMIEEDRTDEKYWDNRVRTHKNDLNRMVWYSEKIREQLVWVERILAPFRHMTVLDMGCGWGRAAYLFDKDKYLGVDFSQEMITLAKQKNPGYEFQKGDGRNFFPSGGTFEIVLMFHMADAMELVKRYKEYATFAVVVVGANDIYIYSSEDFS